MRVLIPNSGSQHVPVEHPDKYMKRDKRVLTLMLAVFAPFASHKPAIASAFSIPHPDDPAKRVEYFLEKPSTVGPWPTVVFLHGHQEVTRTGATISLNGVYCINSQSVGIWRSLFRSPVTVIRAGQQISAAPLRNTRLQR